ncbi:hypothetical protein NDU88_004961 [Pleurodeles waltl]|uniref:Uncharacterized protein n=1 Tax=Pleurodeles waltl TaxID=8319 RepID=A0AAV7VLB0_PLEWA|nr:hypothetical protein NDU88_004961 [Pleurodeles waltl]
MRHPRHEILRALRQLPKRLVRHPGHEIQRAQWQRAQWQHSRLWDARSDAHTKGEPVMQWQEWREYFCNYIDTFEEEEFSAEKKKKVLLHCIGPGGLKLYNEMEKNLVAILIVGTYLHKR